MKRPLHFTLGTVVALVALPFVTFAASILLSVNIADQRRVDAERADCQRLALEIEIRSDSPVADRTVLAQKLLDAYSTRYQQLRCPNPEEK